MNVTIFEAAEELVRKLSAPYGTVNAVAQSRSSPQYIRVLIEPMYWHAIGDVPQEFEGYPVTVERKESAHPLS